MRFVHLSDPHLSSLDARGYGSVSGKRRLGMLSWNRRRRHHHRREVLDALRVAALAERPDLVLISGDFTQLGLGDEIAQVRAWLDAFEGVPVRIVPGNHDFYQPDSPGPALAAWAPYLGLAAAAGVDDFPSHLDLGAVRVIGLCSARPMPWWSAGGEIGGPQLERLDRLLGESRGRLRCVMLHHPPQPGQCARRKALGDAGALCAVLERHAVELVLHGHVHRNRASRLAGGTRIFATASASNAATHAPASYRVFDCTSAAAPWQLAMRLVTVDAGGHARELEQSSWAAGLPPSS
ncbi:MAG: metallophosphoesterase [Gammaproteobacteria bacterium]|nr:metallophosphoesterase [Gammaproteobacteria bacterium]